MDETYLGFRTGNPVISSVLSDQYDAIIGFTGDSILSEFVIQDIIVMMKHFTINQQTQNITDTVVNWLRS